MDATHTLSEAQINELNLAIRAALEASRQAGYAASTYVHDVHTHETILDRRRKLAEQAGSEAASAMWVIFYDLMSRDEALGATR